MAQSEQAPRSRLRGFVAGTALAPEDVAQRVASIHRTLLEGSSTIDEPNFTRLRGADLRRMFERYDEAFFDGLLGRREERARLTFRLSSRLTSSAGLTRVVRRRQPGALPSYDIAVSTTLLAGTFQEGTEVVHLCGLDCADRVEALQRVFEHELVHLVENWLWQESSCSLPRFQDIARRFFAHRQHTHGLITPKERAARAGIGPGARVAFVHRGERLVGVVNRVTRRATVLVEHESGVRYSDGRRYRKYYVPLASLEPQ